jgi:hypothetical protein
VKLWHAAFTAVPFFYLFCATGLSIVKNMCTHGIYTYLIVYGLPLLQNNTASNSFVTNRERCEVLPGCMSLGLQNRKRNGTKCLSACSITINLNVFTFNLVLNAALKSVRQIAC